MSASGHPRSRRTKPHIRPRPLRPKSDRRKSKFDAPLRATNGYRSLGFNHLSQRASDFAERALRNIGVGIPLVDFDIGRPDHLAPLSASAAMNLPKSAGEPASDPAPKTASRAFLLG